MKNVTRVSWEQRITTRVATKIANFEEVKVQFAGNVEPHTAFIYSSFF